MDEFDRMYEQAEREMDIYREQIAKLEERVKELETLLHTVCAERDDIENARMMGLSTIGKLIALIRQGAGEDSPEYQRALELIGAPPAGDVSAPLPFEDDAEGHGEHAPEHLPGGLDPVSATMCEVKADPMKFIEHWKQEYNGTGYEAVNALMEAFECDENQAREWLTDWLVQQRKTRYDARQSEVGQESKG